MIKFVGGYDGQFTYKLYEFWLKNFNNKDGKEFARIIGSINFSDKKFIDWLSGYN